MSFLPLSEKSVTIFNEHVNIVFPSGSVRFSNMCMVFTDLIVEVFILVHCIFHEVTRPVPHLPVHTLVWSHCNVKILFFDVVATLEGVVYPSAMSIMCFSPFPRLPDHYLHIVPFWNTAYSFVWSVLLTFVRT